MTILSPINAGAYSAFILQHQMERYNVAQLAAQQSTIQASYGQKINSNQAETGAWLDLQPELQTSQQFLQGTIDRTNSIYSALRGMMSVIFKAEIEGTTSADTWNSYGASFNSLLSGINSTANSTRVTPNLIGYAPVSSYSFETDIYRAVSSVSHSDLSTNYYITDSGGNRWAKDNDYASLLKQYDSTTGEETGVVAAINGGLRLDSLVGSAITFTINYDTATATQYTGTLTQNGLLVLDAWFYENLETTAGRTDARAALDYAEVKVESSLARFEQALAQANFSYDQAEIAANSLKNLVNDLSRSQLLELQEVDNKASIFNQTNQARISQAQTLRNEYIKMLGVGTNENFFSAMINVLT